MKKSLIINKRKLILFAVAVCVLITVIFVGYGLWLKDKPIFRNVTIGVSDGAPSIEAFLTEYGNPKQARWVTDPTGLDFRVPGEYSITLGYGKQEETVKLTVLDDLPPVLKLEDTILWADEPITPEKFVVEIGDHSDYTVSLDEAYQVPEDYSQQLFVIIHAVDEWGNKTSASATAEFLWAAETHHLELGETLTARDLFHLPQGRIGDIDQSELDRINAAGPGEYVLELCDGEHRQTCTVIVSDTQGPSMELKKLTVYVGDSVKAEDFVLDIFDASGVKDVRMITALDTNNPADVTVIFETVDTLGHISNHQTVLHIISDTIPPEIDGVREDISTTKNKMPDYLDGVLARDEHDGDVLVTYDDSAVDLTKAGTYFVVYSAVDLSGNIKTVKRRVNVTGFRADTEGLVEYLVNQLPADAEIIRDFVRTYVKHSDHWGGDDPVWYGLHNKKGNCYVHALCLKALLDAKDFNTQLIWVTDKSHYWLVIQLEDGSWRHIDATPSNAHSAYSLMTDAQRLETLKGRDWDHSLWPVCE